MVEWHLPPDYIIDNWTDEKLDLMVEKLVERKRRELDAVRGYSTDAKLFANAGKLIKVVKKS